MSEELDQLLGLLENYWGTVCQRRWWILLPALLVWLTVWKISWLLPSTYQSEALILLENQNVPSQYVVPNVNVSVQDRLQVITQQVLSRTRLQATINRYHLYPQSHGLSLLWGSGEPVERMRKDIQIELVPVPGRSDQFTAFKMRYTANSPELAQKVNSDLTQPFVNEGIFAQQQLSEETTSFLETQLAEARTQMEQQEAKVAEFKAKHLGASPNQLEINVQQILTGLQSQLQNSHQALDSLRQQKLYLESLIQQSQSTRANLLNGGGAAADSSITLDKELEKELVDLHLRLQDLKEKYTDDYPDVVALKDKIAKRENLKKLADDAVAANLSSRKTGTHGSSDATEGAQDSSSALLGQLKDQLKTNQLEIQNYQEREGELESQLSVYLARLKTEPKTEQELANISRGYEESKANYNSLLQKKMQSQLATSLEQSDKGDQFRVLDPPSWPKERLGPNRFMFSLGGLALGIVLGLTMVVLLELIDLRIRHEKDLDGLVPTHLLVSIPRLNTLREEKSRILTRWLDLGGVTITIVLMVAGNFYAFFNR